MRMPLKRTLVIVSLPYGGLCFSVALWDRIEPTVFGLPFNLVWVVCWIPLCSLALVLARHIESRRPPSP